MEHVLGFAVAEFRLPIRRLAFHGREDHGEAVAGPPFGRSSPVRSESPDVYSDIPGDESGAALVADPVDQFAADLLLFDQMRLWNTETPLRLFGQSLSSRIAQSASKDQTPVEDRPGIGFDDHPDRKPEWLAGLLGWHCVDDEEQRWPPSSRVGLARFPVFGFDMCTHSDATCWVVVEWLTGWST